MTRYNFGLWLALGGLLVAPSFALAQVSVLDNGSMELGDGPAAPDPAVADDWTEFGGPNVERSGSANVAPPAGGYALKAFGDTEHNFAGAYQEVTGISVGQNVTVSVKLFSPTGDKLGGTGEAGLVVEFVDNANNTIPGWAFFTYPFNASSPADTWVPAVLGPYTAPANTYKVRVSCRLKWTVGSVEGAVYWDDAQLTVGAGPNLLLNGDFETPGVGAGQSPIGIDFWGGFNDQEKSGDWAHDGSFSLKLGTREAYSGLYQNMATLVGGDHIYLTAYAYHPSTDPLLGNSVAGIKLEFQDPLPGAPAEELLSFDANDPVEPQNTWVLVTYSTTVPTDMHAAEIVFIADDTSSTNGPIYFDSVSATRNGGGNQLQNSSFEDLALAHWTLFGDTSCTPVEDFADVDAHSGDQFLKLAGSCVQGVKQKIAVAPGEALVISAYLRSRSDNPFNDEAGPRAGVKVEWHAGFKPDNIDIGPSGNTLKATDPTNTWKLLTIDYTMPVGNAAIARFTNIIVKSTSTTGRAYIDSCTATVLNWTPFCYGDLDCDGTIGFGDINPFVLYLSNPAGWQATYATCPLANGDINGDGTFPSFGDINPFVSLLSTSPIPTCP